MRKHIWPAEDNEPDKAIEETQKKADEKIGELKRTIDQQLSEILQRQKLADDRVSGVRTEVRRLLDRAIVGSRQVETEAREEAIREHILRSLRLLRERQPRTTVGDLVSAMPFPAHRVVPELSRMKEEGLIELNSEPVMPDTLVRPARSKPVESEQDRD
jgi:hypothetical protein